MATTIASVQTILNSILRDTGTSSVSAAERLSAISQAVQEMITESGFSQQITTYAFNYLDTVHSYNITTAVPGFQDATDLRRDVDDHETAFVRKNARTLAVDIGQDATEEAFAVDYQDSKVILMVNHESKYNALQLHNCDSLTSDGTWTADTTNSDATNLTLDEVEFEEGSASLNFDADVSQSGNNRATIYNADFSATDLTDHENLSSLVFRVYIPDTTNFSSVTAYWGDSSTTYWSASATTDYLGNAWATGWNRVSIAWSSATKTGAPDITVINYLRFDFNYAAGQTDDTDFRLDDIKIIRPEELTLFYESKYIGTSGTGTKLLAFTATGDVPFYSGLYDYFDNPVAHRAAAIIYEWLGSFNDASLQNAEYQKQIRDIRKRFPHSTLKETVNFKAKGLNFKRRKI